MLGWGRVTTRLGFPGHIFFLGSSLDFQNFSKTKFIQVFGLQPLWVISNINGPCTCSHLNNQTISRGRTFSVYLPTKSLFICGNITWQRDVTIGNFVSFFAQPNMVTLGWGLQSKQILVGLCSLGRTLPTFWQLHVYWLISLICTISSQPTTIKSIFLCIKPTRHSVLIGYTSDS